MQSPDGPPSYPLADLCALVNMSPRTVRYYVQQGLVARPDGETRAARYGPRHLEQLLQIRKWSEAGVSLDRIRELLHGAPPPVPARGAVPGSLEVRSHLTVAAGIELVIEPGRAGLSPDQLRRFARGVMALYADVLGDEANAIDLPDPDNNKSRYKSKNKEGQHEQDLD